MHLMGLENSPQHCITDVLPGHYITDILLGYCVTDVLLKYYQGTIVCTGFHPGDSLGHGAVCKTDLRSVPAVYLLVDF